jgi:hypothetical protein
MDKKIEEIMNDEPRLPKRTSMLVLVLGVVGGTAFFVAVAVWYFTAVDRPPRNARLGIIKLRADLGSFNDVSPFGLAKHCSHASGVFLLGKQPHNLLRQI